MMGDAVKTALLLALFVLVGAAGTATGYWWARCAGPGRQAVTVPEPPPPATAPGQAKGVRFRPATHSFGTLHEGEARTVKLRIERPDTAPLRLGRLYSPCPCITVSTETRSVPAGEAAHLQVGIHSLTLSGKVSFPVYAQVLEPEEAILRAEVTAEVTRVPAAIRLAPAAFHLGSIRGEATATVAFTNLTKSVLTLDTLRVRPAGLMVTTPARRTVGPGETVSLTVALVAGRLPTGPVRGIVEVVTDHSAHALMRIPVDGTVLP